MEQRKKLEDFYIIKNGKKLHYGYTTGSCAAAAAKAAALMLLTGEEISNVELLTPKGILLDLKVCQMRREADNVTCAIKKYAGDDPDVTDGILIFANVKKTKKTGIELDGGVGVGRITKKGLGQPIGSAAINKVPRKMILEAVEMICNEYDYEGGIKIRIEVPKGVEIARKTFNKRLGIEGGISILGTTGIVVPMSEEALIKSIEMEIKMRIENGAKYLLFTPGNYGENFLKEELELDVEQNIKCSNFIGEAVDMAVNLEARGLLLVGHVGKLIKVAGGIMNTHSRCADSRMEILGANAIKAGASLETVKEILDAVTTEQGLQILQHEKLLEKTMGYIVEKIEFYIKNRSYGQLEIGVILFSNELGLLGQSESVCYLKDMFRYRR
ncbi:cobalt-precorrin-5B (C(1))-methyltransferase CbiD [Anaerosacchariphilus polymeriproducens]|uniref:Cobalt-precorrin-5B C(1)-methyltransferase n=1 Tax=Anaerosacchariphilus polymeriproducens TaxID=1812858 RepID=A0A371AYF7_9FIRM|nr:cobalt-precorrin-5B (C(1))-methyltransferase CbiD [Anaerosacchariphilus polymeriproducens]RDU24532.1 cobalamin biosynthesis protein CbiD [Anaerosacchariphilus polymeriproducens]